MRVLITGATGFLGGYIVECFARHGFDVIAFGRNARIGGALRNCVFTQGDFTNYAEIERAVQNADIVIHAGALSTVWGKWPDFEKANVVGTRNVAEACLRQSAKRLVFISSPSIYASQKDAFDIHEDNPLPAPPLSHYIRSKIMAESIVAQYGKQGLYTAIIRPRGLFGIGDRSIIPRLIDANGKKGIPLIDGGNKLVDITDVRNAAHAVSLAATAKNVSGEAFNITNGEPCAFKTILEMLLGRIGVTPNYRPLSFRSAYQAGAFLEMFYKILHLPGEPALTKYTAATLGTSQTLNIDKARGMLGYRPIYSLREGIETYAEWWKDNH